MTTRTLYRVTLDGAQVGGYGRWGTALDALCLTAESLPHGRPCAVSAMLSEIADNVREGSDLTLTLDVAGTPRTVALKASNTAPVDPHSRDPFAVFDERTN